MRNLIIISYLPLINSNIAAEKRINLYIKTLQIKSVESIFLYCSSGILEYNLLNGIKKIKKTNLSNFLIRFSNKKTCFLIYPSTKMFPELALLFYLKFILKRSVFYELNEVRKYSITLETSVFDLFRKPFWFIKTKIKYFLSFIQELTLPYYDGLITISDNLSMLYFKRNKNILQIPILAEVPVKINPPLRYNYDNPFKIVFTGTVNIRKENLHFVLNSMYNLRSYNIELHLYGSLDTQNKKELENLKNKYNLNKNLYYHGVVNSSSLNSVYKKAHLLILPRGYTKQNHYGFSTKLSDYLVSGRPILVTNVSDNPKYIKDNINGFIIPPDSLESMTNKIKYIYSNYNSLNESISNNALQTVKESFDYKLYSNKLFQFLIK